MHPTPSTSASPAPFRITSASRHTDGPSPSKRRKLAASQPALNSSSNSYHSSTSDPQLDTERRASSSRVLNVWSALEDKYALRLDEDDIVDLRSGDLVKDRGVLSSKDGTWDIGCFADPTAAQGNENSAQEDDDDEDEIGVWGSDSELDHQFNPVHVPPVRELDPEDAEDLRAFLAAEQARKPLRGIDDFSEDEDDLDVTRNGNCDTDFDPNLEIEGSIVEIEAGSAPALPPTDSDDELAGYDDTVGEGALLWEVGTEMSNCSEPLGAESGMVMKPLHTLPRRNQTPAQLRTPPLSRSSVKKPNESFPRTSPRPLRRPPVDLPPPSLPKSRKGSTWTSSKKKVPHSPDDGNKVVASLSTGKGKEREFSLSPTKNLIAEVTLPMSRANTVFRQCEDGMLKHDDVPRTPTQTPRRDPISQSEGNHAVKHHARPPTSPKRSVKSKRAVSDETDTDVDVGNDDDTKVRRARERRVSESYAKPMDLSESLSSRRRRHSTSGPLRRPTTSTSLEDSIASSPSHDLRRSPLYHPHPAPSFPSHDFWPPYTRHAHTPAPSFPAFYPPPPNVKRELSVAPAEVQIHIAQAMQSLSYLAFGLPPPPPSSSAHPSHSHSLHTPPSSSPPSSMRSYTAPYFPHHTQGHPPWFYPPSSYPYPYPSAMHTHPSASSSAASSTMPNSLPEPPSSPPEASSPLSGRRNRKRVSFPEDVVWSESEPESGTDTDPDTDVGDVRHGTSVRKEKGKLEGKARGQVPNTTTPNIRSRRDSQEPSKGSGNCYRNPSPRRKR